MTPFRWKLALYGAIGALTVIATNDKIDWRFKLACAAALGGFLAIKAALSPSKGDSN